MADISYPLFTPSGAASKILAQLAANEITPAIAVNLLAVIYEREGEPPDVALAAAERMIENIGGVDTGNLYRSDDEYLTEAELASEGLAGKEGTLGPLLPEGELPWKSPGEREMDLSKRYGGRATLFTEYLANLANPLAPYAERLMEKKYDPLNLQWRYAQMGAEPEENFATYLRGAPGRFSPEQWTQAMQNMGGFYGGDPSTMTPAQEGFREELRGTSEDTGQAAFARNMIRQGMLAGVPGTLRYGADRALTRRFDKWRGQNPLGDLFQEFINRGYKF